MIPITLQSAGCMLIFTGHQNDFPVLVMTPKPIHTLSLSHSSGVVGIPRGLGPHWTTALSLLSSGNSRKANQYWPALMSGTSRTI
jgi:hypothetical protein